MYVNQRYDLCMKCSYSFTKIETVGLINYASSKNEYL
jgi:hypothetical protein